MCTSITSSEAIMAVSILILRTHFFFWFSYYDSKYISLGVLAIMAVTDQANLFLLGRAKLHLAIILYFNGDIFLGGLEISGVHDLILW